MLSARTARRVSDKGEAKARHLLLRVVSASGIDVRRMSASQVDSVVLTTARSMRKNGVLSQADLAALFALVRNREAKHG